MIPTELSPPALRRIHLVERPSSSVERPADAVMIRGRLVAVMAAPATSGGVCGAA
jgi:hypothetical protein